MDAADPADNRVAPTGAYADSGWQWRAFVNGMRPATLVSPTQALTAQHFGNAASFVYNGNSYTVLSRTSMADLQLITLDTSPHGDFTSWASIYRDTDEIGKELVVHGIGPTRGAAVAVGGDPKGWLYGGDATRAFRWGTNTVSGHEDYAVVGDQKLLYATFTNVGTHASPVGQTSDEAHLTNGDSGGGVFIQDGAARGSWPP